MTFFNRLLYGFPLTITCAAMCSMLSCSSREDHTANKKDEAVAKQAQEVSPQAGHTIPTQQLDVRVRLKRIRNRGERLIFGKPGQRLRITNTQESALLGAFSGPLEVYLASDGWRFQETSGRGRVTLPLQSLILREANRQGSVSSSISIQSDKAQAPRQYPGIFRLEPRSEEGSGVWDLINEVPIEQYLPGVLAGELYAGWHEQTYEAQAIAARSYAINEILSRVGRSHFDVESSIRSQVYQGTTTNKEALISVQRTHGEVLSYQGRLVPGYYASCCGGQPALASEAIGPNPINEMKPLNGHGPPAYCHQASVFHWTRKTTRQLVEERLRIFGKSQDNDELASLGQLKAIELKSVNPFGRALSMAISDRQGQVIELSAAQLRRALMRGDAAGGRASLQLLSENIRIKVDDDFIGIEGWGFGHGVGLCQYGAQAMAQAGQEAHAIVEFYYPGVVIIKAYGASESATDNAATESDHDKPLMPINNPST
jgi:stage II sporulation protein D